VVNPGTATATGHNVTVTGVRSDGDPLNARYPAGTTTIAWTATDDATPDEHTASCTQTIVVNANDTTPPTITLNGPNPMTVECHTTFTDPGATAHDNCAEDVEVTASGNVDANTPGTYTITYNATDPSGNQATPVTRTVIVVDTTPPTITITGGNSTTVECHTSYTDAGATATDSCSGGVVPVTSSSDVNVNAVGTYHVTYTSTDGTNVATATRTVTVVDTTPPTITLNGSNPMTVECHTSFTDPGATAHDGCSGDSAATASGTVNVNSPGTYTITYNASDPSGNAATAVTRTVKVVDTIAPTLTLKNVTTSLWPPNHKYRTINLADLVLSASDGCDGTVDINDVVIAQVTSDETENGNGDGNTLNDIVIASDCRSVQLRAERDGSGNGRVYTITFRVTDAAGNVTTKTAKVTVPQSQNGSPAIDSGPHYTVNSSNCP
jgi:hypothetical protein